MQSDAEHVVRAVIGAAKTGDMTAAKIILDRIAPARKGAPVMFDVPELITPADLAPAVTAVTLVSVRAAGPPSAASPPSAFWPAVRNPG
jgi:hypothetical protein